MQLLLLGAVVLPVVQALPGSDHGKLEDVHQAFGVISHTPALAALCAAAWLGLAMLNPLSMCIGAHNVSARPILASTSLFIGLCLSICVPVRLCMVVILCVPLPVCLPVCPFACLGVRKWSVRSARRFRTACVHGRGTICSGMGGRTHAVCSARQRHQVALPQYLTL